MADGMRVASNRGVRAGGGSHAAHVVCAMQSVQGDGATDADAFVGVPSLIVETLAHHV